jgi:hypothetical protein
MNEYNNKSNTYAPEPEIEKKPTLMVAHGILNDKLTRLRIIKNHSGKLVNLMNREPISDEHHEQPKSEKHENIVEIFLSLAREMDYELDKIEENLIEVKNMIE